MLKGFDYRIKLSLMCVNYTQSLCLREREFYLSATCTQLTKIQYLIL